MILMSRQFELALPVPPLFFLPPFVFHPPSANCFSTLFFSANHFLLTVDQSQAKAEQVCLSHVNSPESWWSPGLSFYVLPLPQSFSSAALSLWGSRPGHQRQGQTHPLQSLQGPPDFFIVVTYPRIPPERLCSRLQGARRGHPHTPVSSLGLIWEM